MKYIGFLPDKTSIMKDSLEELNNVPHIEYILTETLPEGWPVNGWPKYSVINPDETNRIIKIGNYQVIDIDYFDKRYLKGRIATIIEVDSKQSHKFEMRKHNSDFLVTELLPLLNELNQFGNLKRFLKFKQAVDKIELLELRLIERNKTISELKAKLEAYEGKNEA